MRKEDDHGNTISAVNAGNSVEQKKKAIGKLLKQRNGKTTKAEERAVGESEDICVHVIFEGLGSLLHCTNSFACQHNS